MGKKSGPAPPPAPDPVATAKAQGEQNVNAAIAQANLNRIDQYTPQGSLTYSQIGTNADGTPKYSQTQTLSPDEQAKYEQANKVALALGGLAGSNISRVQQAQATPFSYDGMTPLRTGVGSPTDMGALKTSLDYSKLTALPGTTDFGAEQRRVSDAVYQQAASRLNPEFQQREGDMRSRLAAQGISENSDAYRRELDNEGRTRNDAYNDANYRAIQAGSSEQSRLFGLAMSARQQGQNEVDTASQFTNDAEAQRFAQEGTRWNQQAADAAFNNQARQQQIEEAAYLRNLPINEIASLLGTGPGVADPNFNPVSQVGVAAPDYAGLVANNYNQRIGMYNQQQAARSNMLGSIFGAAGSLGAAAIMSDRRFKENIRRIGTLANGIATYAFNYLGDKAQQFGVMAQEVLQVIPEAVVQGSDGYLRVNYGKVY